MGKPYFVGRFVTETILGGDYYRLVEPFGFWSEKFQTMIQIPAGFIFDKESVPIIKGSNERGGGFHDYACRIDSEPVFTKQQAATLYLEVQKCRDDLLKDLENIRARKFMGRVRAKYKQVCRWVKRNLKTLAVRLACGYHHKFKVLDKLETISGVV